MGSRPIEPRPLARGIYVDKSEIDGKGCFAAVPFAKGRKIAEYQGERISRIEVARRLAGRRRIRICGIDTYWAIDGSCGGNGTQYVNHSCAPNIFLRIMHGHILLFALRDIRAGEELTLDYVDSYHSDSTRCYCKAPTCRSTINKIETNRKTR
jgi:SET domain-containing protein